MDIMLSYRSEDTLFHNYDMYMLDISYVGSKKVIKEPILFLSYDNQQKETQGQAKKQEYRGQI